MLDSPDSIRASGGPSATTRPPSGPAPGPRSMSQSAARIVASSCSTTTTLLPRSRSSNRPARSRARCLEGASPWSARRGRSRPRPTPSRSGWPGGLAATRRRRACRPPGPGSGNSGPPVRGISDGHRPPPPGGGRPDRETARTGARPGTIGRRRWSAFGQPVDRQAADRHRPGLGSEPRPKAFRADRFRPERFESRSPGIGLRGGKSSCSRSARVPT